MNLAEGLTAALEYIELHLEGEISIADAAREAYLSEFYFQRIFGALCGMTVGEYIRNRRLTLAAQELASSDAKVIDVALKYGYSSPDSFSRAFAKFHGISPSAAKEGAPLKSFAPLRIKLTLEGGNMMDYQIKQKEKFTVVGVCRSFDPATSYVEIPKFWGEHFTTGIPIMGKYGVCIDMDTDGGHDHFNYLIADDFRGGDIPEGCVTREIPAGTWAVFPCTMATLQDTNTKMWSEWLPNIKEYKLAGNYNIELYTDGAQDSYCELWLPVEKV